MPGITTIYTILFRLSFMIKFQLCPHDLDLISHVWKTVYIKGQYHGIEQPLLVAIKHIGKQL
jgi:hypothetical protein